MTMAEEKQSIEDGFATTTTLHGIQYIATSRWYVVKCLWLLIFLGGFGLCTWQITLRIEAYLEYSVNTEIQLTFLDEMDFPAVTICNFNRYRNSSLTGDDFNIIKYLWEAEDYNYFSDDPDSFDYATLFGSETFNTSEFTLRTGFLLNGETLETCSWRGKTCTADNFTHSFTSFGNCYTFNSGEDGRTLLQVNEAGAGNALQITINIQQDEYTETSSGNIEAGLKMLVHSQDEPPLIESRGVAIPPGVHAFTATKRLHVKNLDSPYGDCDNNLKLIYYDVYTISGCLIECRLDRIVAECGCRPIRYPGNATECSPKQTNDCATDVISRIKSGALEACYCPVPCEYTSFQTTVNYASIPGKSVEAELATKYGVVPGYINENFIILDVYYEELNFQEFTESASMTFSALLSDVGGQLGLFIGASVITFAELGQYVVMKLRSIFCKNSGKISGCGMRPIDVKPIQSGIDNYGRSFIEMS